VDKPKKFVQTLVTRGCSC